VTSKRLSLVRGKIILEWSLDNRVLFVVEWFLQRSLDLASFVFLAFTQYMALTHSLASTQSMV